jgi:hypothetical protein
MSVMLVILLEVSERDQEFLDYARTIAALQRLIGRRVTARVSWHSGPTVATIGVGYLQAPEQFGYRRDDETTVFLITEEAEPVRGYHLPFWPDIRIHDVPEFVGWTNGARVDCAFEGIGVTVELADSDEWLEANRVYEAEQTATAARRVTAE